MSALPLPDYHPSPPAPSCWTERAACRGEDPDLFYPPEGERGRAHRRRAAATTPAASLTRAKRTPGQQGTHNDAAESLLMAHRRRAG